MREFRKKTTYKRETEKLSKNTLKILSTWAFKNFFWEFLLWWFWMCLSLTASKRLFFCTFQNTLHLESDKIRTVILITIIKKRMNYIFWRPHKKLNNIYISIINTRAFELLLIGQLVVRITSQFDKTNDSTIMFTKRHRQATTHVKCENLCSW